MTDYTPEGVVYNQREIAISYLYLMDKKLSKINRKLAILTAVGIAVMLIKHKDDIKALKYTKGE